MRQIILITAAILAPLWLATSVEAQIIFTPPNFNPPDTPPEGRTQGGGSRSSFVQQGKPLTALIPKTQLGLTMAKYPTFFIYVPQSSEHMAVFTLLDEDNKIVYETRVTLPNQAGVVSFSLPDTGTLAPLKVGKPYQWYFSIVYDFDDRSKDRLVQGWIQRVEPSPDLTQKLEQTDSKNRPALYASAGIWHDTLTTLAQLRRSTPNDATLAQQWEELLKSEAVGLNDIAKEPLLEKLSALDSSPAPPLDTENAPNRSEAGKPGAGGGFNPPEFGSPGRTAGGGTR
ncbi:MAG TPA: DUF928 domain-containing protein [Allocoleopsis sp.]